MKLQTNPSIAPNKFPVYMISTEDTSGEIGYVLNYTTTTTKFPQFNDSDSTINGFKEQDNTTTTIGDPSDEGIIVYSFAKKDKKTKVKIPIRKMTDWLRRKGKNVPNSADKIRQKYRENQPDA